MAHARGKVDCIWIQEGLGVSGENEVGFTVFVEG